MNVYDFDETIYKKDSSVELYKFLIWRHPSIFFRCIGIQMFAFMKYKLQRITKEELKTAYFIFLQYIDVDAELEMFVKKEFVNINSWYLKQKDESDVIISASPRFLVEAFAERLEIKNVLASEVDKNTGKFVSPNCHGAEKVVRFRQYFKDARIDNFYSDSKSDTPMARLAKNAYIVEGEKLKQWDF